MSRILTLIALALTTAAVVASVAGADNGAKVDPLAVSYLTGQGLTPSEVTSWTTGACSGQNKDASCYAMLDRKADAAPSVDPLAVSYLTGQGLTPSEVTSWTTGDCSHEVKAASCYAMFGPTAIAATPTSGFSWGDAGIGAIAALGIVLLLGGLGASLLARHNRGDHTAHA